MNTLHTKSLFLFLLVGLQSCGAPTKSAADVRGIFFSNSQDLGTQVSGLCETLRARTKPPSLEGIELRQESCLTAGQSSQDLSKIKQLNFAGFEANKLSAPSTTGGEKTVHFQIRTQVWLNQSIVGLASKLGSLLSKKVADGSAGANSVISPTASAGGNLGGVVTPKITVTTPLQFDSSAQEFQIAVNLLVTGIILLNNDISVTGKILDNSIAVNIRSLADQVYEKSILKNFKILAMIVPYAGDVYLDLVLDLNVHSLGVDGLIERQLRTALSSMFKSGADLLVSTQ